MRISIALFLLLLAAFRLNAQQPPQASPWHLTADRIDPARYHGITVANGMVGLVSSAEPLKVKDVVLNGVFDTYGRGRVSNILKGFNFADMYLDVIHQGQGRRLAAADVRSLRQTLDMKRAVLTTSFDYQEVLSVEYDLRALRHLPFTSMIELTVRAKQDVTIIPASMLRAPEILRDVAQFYSVIDRPHVKIPLMTSIGNSPTGKHRVAASSSFLFEGHSYPALIHEEWDYDMHLTRLEKRLKAGETFRMTVVATEVSTEHYADPQNEAERLTIYAALEGRERLIERHEAAWAELWKSDIILEGDPEAQRDIRSMLYHLYSFVREGTAYSPSPMGLSGLGYNGHVFWDTELWMYPPLLVLQPQIARSLLEYRFERLEMARQNARSHGFRGAMFPWESDGEGQEATPVWALSGPFEHHITGCVGVAFWNYYLVTRDKEWLRTRGYPVLREVADFWVSRTDRDAQGNCHIYNVVGADEWAENVDDNAFTNGVAKEALRFAALAAGELGEQPDPQWTATADCIPLLQLPGGVTREHATYQDTMIKQGDVNLLAFPLKVITDPAQIRRDLEFYEPRISPTGPAMGYAALSVLYSRLGEPEKAKELFFRGYQPNEVPPFGVLSECPGCSNPYFATGAGGMLQAMLFGFGGLDLSSSGIGAPPPAKGKAAPPASGIRQLPVRLPAGWQSLTITGAGIQEETFTVKR
ncbi:MAG: glycoside hydrolase family 65 protein [Bacteroidia bacterium]|nr:glycoside hydrolase family 65 protein [Bacteroidia bacterium]